MMLMVAFHLVSGSMPQQDPKKKRIEILNADLYTYDRKIIANADRLVGNVRLSHNNVLLNCDSAYSYKDSNMVDAFGHVHIIQGDTLNLYGDRIKYEGNSKIARVRGHVKLINKSITLTTDELTFDLRANIGNYHTWGTIIDTANVLVSKIGRYYSNEDMFFFKDSVKVTNKDFILTADTLKYNSKMERVILVGPTHIVGTTKQGTLYSEKGWYDTRTNIAELYKASKIIGKEQSLQGDTIFYSRSAGTGRARSRVLLSDTTNHIAITGRSGVYNEKTKIAFVTDSAVFMQFSKKDTLFLHADTLKSMPDVAKKEVAKKLIGQLLIPKKSNSGKSEMQKGKSTEKDGTKKEASIPNQQPVAQKDTSNNQATKEISSPLDPQTGLNAVADTGKVRVTMPASVTTVAIKKDSVSISKDTLKLANTIPGKETTPAKTLIAVADTGKVVAQPSGLAKLNPAVKDSAKAVSDTLHSKDDKDKKIFMAYHRVRFYKKDLQGICDSLAFQMKDSVMRLFNDPVLWSEVHQLTADKIEYRPHTPGPDIARLENNGFIISQEDSFKYNQISGKILIGYIYNNALKKIEVNGNAVTLYFLKNKDHYSGMNKLESSKINVYLLKSKIDSISFFPQPEGKTVPIKDLTPEEAKLKGFLWRESEKPKTRFDLYPLDDKRKKIAGPDKKPASKSKQNANF
jgi:hypothetical protein